MVKYCLSLWVKKVQAASLSSACQSICGSISDGREGIPGTAMTPSSSFSEISVYFTLGGCRGPEMKMLPRGRLLAQMTEELDTLLGGTVLYPLVKQLRAETNWHTATRL